MGPNSDYDFLVIKRGKFNHWRLLKKISDHLSGKGQAVDVVVASTEDIERYGDSPYLVYYPALKEGKVVYEGEAPSTDRSARVAEPSQKQPSTPKTSESGPFWKTPASTRSKPLKRPSRPSLFIVARIFPISMILMNFLRSSGAMGSRFPSTSGKPASYRSTRWSRAIQEQSAQSPKGNLAERSASPRPWYDGPSGRLNRREPWN